MSPCSSTKAVVVGEHIRTIPRKHKINRSEYLVTGSIPVVDQSQELIAGYIDDEERAYEGPLPVIVFGDHTCTLKYVDFAFAVGADGTQLIQPTEGFDIRYFYYSLHNLGLEHFGYQRHFKYLKEKRIPWHPLEDQRKIAATLSAYDDLIENNNRRIRILEEMAQMIYREWFVNFRYPGHENVKMVESEMGMIPDGWDVGELSDACHIIMGQSPKSEFYNRMGEGLPFHQGVTDYGARFPVDRLYCTVRNRIAERGDILFSVRAPVGRLNIANQRIVIGRGLCAIRSHNDCQCFVFHQFRELFSEEDMIGGGTIFKAVTKEDMHRIKILIPEESITRRFEEIAQPIASEVETLTGKNTNLHSTRDLLLPKLISGELDVADLDISTSESAGND